MPNYASYWWIESFISAINRYVSISCHLVFALLNSERLTSHGWKHTVRNMYTNVFFWQRDHLSSVFVLHVAVFPMQILVYLCVYVGDGSLEVSVALEGLHVIHHRLFATSSSPCLVYTWRNRTCLIAIENVKRPQPRHFQMFVSVSGVWTVIYCACYTTETEVLSQLPTSVCLSVYFRRRRTSCTNIHGW